MDVLLILEQQVNCLYIPFTTSFSIYIEKEKQIRVLLILNFSNKSSSVGGVHHNASDLHTATR